MSKPTRKKEPAPLLKEETTSQPVRMTAKQMEDARALKERTGHKLATIRRAAIAYAFPRFLSGEADLVSVIAALEKQNA